MFDDDPKTPETPETFTIGDKEYTQEQLNELVAKGNKAAEIEANHGDLDNLVSDWGRTKSEIGELRKFKEEQEALKAQTQVDPNTLSPEEQVRLAKREAAKLGFVTDENISEFVNTQVEARELENTTAGLVDELADMGIEADPKTIIKFMDAADIDNPQDAISKLYGPQIKSWQEQQLEENKPQDWLSQSTPGAGQSRKPDNVKIDDSNVLDIFREAIGANE